MKKVIILFLLLNISQPALGQDLNSNNFELNLSLENSLLLGVKTYHNIIKETSYTDVYPISLYLSFLINSKSNIALEIKPGIVFGGEYYTGIEAGLFLRYYLMNRKYYTSIGLNLHKNFGTAHGTMISVSSTDESVGYLGFKVAYKPKTYFAFTLGYNYSLSDYWLFSISEANSDYYSVKLKHVLKLGFEFSL